MFLDHTLAIADAHLALVRAHRSEQLELLEVQLEPDCWRRYTTPDGRQRVLCPDLKLITVDPNDAAYVNTWFIEIDRGTENPARLLAKSAQYMAYAVTGTEQDGGRGFPIVVWVMPTEDHAAKLRASIRAALDLDASLFRTTTAQDFIDLIAKGAV